MKYTFLSIKRLKTQNKTKKRGSYVRRHRTTIHLYPDYPLLEGDSLDRRGYRIPIPAAGIQVSVSPSIRVSTYRLLAEDRSGYPFAGEYDPMTKRCHYSPSSELSIIPPAQKETKQMLYFPQFYPDFKSVSNTAWIKKNFPF